MQSKSHLGNIMAIGLVTLVTSMWNLFVEVSLFWKNRLWQRLTRQAPKQQLRRRMAIAKTYEDWYEAGLELDSLLGNDLWRQNPVSKDYDYKLIHHRLQLLLSARHSVDPVPLINHLRSGLLRNLGNITNTALYNRSHIGTKHIIEDYITTIALSLEHISTLTASHTFPSQAKLDFFQDTRQSFGRTALILQGGAIFGLCHLGVVKALHHHHLLPRIITGTAVGALIAALVGIHTDAELPHFLSGSGIDLTAFSSRPAAGSWKRKLQRFLTRGYLLDIRVLESCVRANVGELTFEEAYIRTKRILNIAVSTHGNQVPTLLNYLTAPNVLIWSAACASNAPSPLFDTVELMCKDHTGAITPWAPGGINWRKHGAPNSSGSGSGSSSNSSTDDRDSPHTRTAELFNVNHFIVSQARPYLLPFLTSPLFRHKRRGLWLKAMRLAGMEVMHMLRQMDMLGLLPGRLRGWLVGEIIPGPTVTVVPDVGWSDFWALVENPRGERVDYWVEKGERSVWGAVELIRVAVGVEVVLDRIYCVLRGLV